MKLTPVQLVQRQEHLKTLRNNWENYWQDLADFFLPKKSTVTVDRTRGDRREDRLLDNTGLMSNELLAGALHGMLTNPHRIFFDLLTGDDELDSRDEVRVWLQDSTKRMHDVLNNSNFQTEVHEYYQDLGVFGTTPMLILEDEVDVVRFETQFIDNIFITENHLGKIDEVHRIFKWTARNLLREFGSKGMHEEVMKVAEDDDQRTFEVIHAVYPKDHDKSKKSTGLPYISQWMLKNPSHELRVSGFREWPYAIGRWAKGTNEIYGRSPAMNALAEMKTLNKMVETVIKAAQKTVDPPLQAPDDGFIFPLRTRPGSVNIRRAGSPDRIEPLFPPPRVDFGFEVMQERRNRVREAFFIDQLKLREGPQMTATEVEQRAEESMRLMGPIIGRQENEFLGPLVDRVFAIMLRKKLFNEIPQALAGKTLQVRYSGLIAKAQRLNETRGMIRALNDMAPFMELDQASADNLNSDNAIKVIAKAHGFPQVIIRDKDEVEGIREARQEAQQKEQEKDDQARQADVLAKTGQASAAINQGG